MEIEISATELSRNLSAILNRIRYAGEHFVVLRGGVPVCSLGPPRLAEGKRTLGQLLASLPPVDEDYRADVQAAIDSQGSAEGSRWEP